jgi:hypothetical protein
VKDLKRPAPECVDELPASDLAVERRNQRGARKRGLPNGR